MQHAAHEIAISPTWTHKNAKYLCQKVCLIDKKHIFMVPSIHKSKRFLFKDRREYTMGIVHVTPLAEGGIGQIKSRELRVIMFL